MNGTDKNKLIDRIKTLDGLTDDERPIILIGGSNGGGKTTLFEVISGALYGLKIESKEHFNELLNQGAIGETKPEISLQITFVGKAIGQEQMYKKINVAHLI